MMVSMLSLNFEPLTISNIKVVVAARFPRSYMLCNTLVVRRYNVEPPMV